MTWFALPTNTARRTRSDSQREHFDHLGAIAGVAGLILINFALNKARQSDGTWSYYLFLLLIVIRDLPPLTVASQFSSVAPVGFCAAMVVPYLLRKMRVPYTVVSILIAPLAMNWSFPSGTTLMSNAVSKKHQGVAASLISTGLWIATQRLAMVFWEASTMLGGWELRVV
ncbi:hypothetical protein AC578_10260 [Pseudocercospora eumusae]|uniref:Uncharacterized protein n=1 Tax=Pseudocercospora eumusae TaxID=321146 RepID=A0A139HYH9_9PEZI|nr:hypothetical protein AC578_10260 [Pseudocercospora eumusae]